MLIFDQELFHCKFLYVSFVTIFSEVMHICDKRNTGYTYWIVQYNGFQIWCGWDLSFSFYGIMWKDSCLDFMELELLRTNHTWVNITGETFFFFFGDKYY